MSGELRDLLAQAAAEVHDPLDIDDLRRRGRQVRRRRRAVVAGGAGLVVVAVATGVLTVSGLPSRPDVAVDEGPTSRPSVVDPSVTRDEMAAAVARSASDALDVARLADGEEVERLRDVLGDLDVVGAERVLPGRWGDAWREGDELVRVAASAAVYPHSGEPFCALVALAPGGRFAGVPASGDAYGGCGDGSPQSTPDDPLLRGLTGPESGPSPQSAAMQACTDMVTEGRSLAAPDGNPTVEAAYTARPADLNAWWQQDGGGPLTTADGAALADEGAPVTICLIHADVVPAPGLPGMSEEYHWDLTAILADGTPRPLTARPTRPTDLPPAAEQAP